MGRNFLLTPSASERVTRTSWGFPVASTVNDTTTVPTTTFLLAWLLNWGWGAKTAFGAEGRSPTWCLPAASGFGFGATAWWPVLAPPSSEEADRWLSLSGRGPPNGKADACGVFAAAMKSVRPNTVAQRIWQPPQA